MSGENITKKLKKIIDTFKLSLPTLCISVLAAWCLTLTFFNLTSEYKFTQVPYFADRISLLLFVAFIVCLTVIFSVLGKMLSKKINLLALVLSFAAYGAVAVAKSSNDASVRGYSAIGFCVIAAVVLAVCVTYIKHEELSLFKTDIGARLAFIIVSVAFVLFSAFFIVLLWARTESFCSPCYDMGIFAQMYDNMTTTLLPLTTCERGFELSHFAVHFSPVLYLLLPFCYIFEPTAVLVFAQILLVFSGVFPLFLICRKIGLKNIYSTLISVGFLLYPAMSSGAFYDFHENAFLTPFILWTLYFIHTEKYIPAFICALGVLSVKEDAAIYVAFIALFVIFERKKRLVGSLMLAMTVAYFLMATAILSSGSQGLMLGSRYYNVIGYDGSFVDLLRVALVNPALYVVESFTPEKLLYFISMLAPLAFLPLLSKKPSRFLLLAPLFVMNLVTDYKYQYDLGFQYSFGSGAMLIYISALNLSDLLADTRAEEAEAEAECIAAPQTASSFAQRTASVLVVFSLLSSLFFMAARLPSQSYYVKRYATEPEIRATVNDVLSRIDREKSVTATSMYLTHLYDIDELYHTSQAIDGEGEIAIYTDLVVLDLRSYISDSSKADKWSRKYLKSGYEILEEHEGIILVLQKAE